MVGDAMKAALQPHYENPDCEPQRPGFCIFDGRDDVNSPHGMACRGLVSMGRASQVLA